MVSRSTSALFTDYQIKWQVLVTQPRNQKSCHELAIVNSFWLNLVLRACVPFVLWWERYATTCQSWRRLKERVVFGFFWKNSSLASFGRFWLLFKLYLAPSCAGTYQPWQTILCPQTRWHPYAHDSSSFSKPQHVPATSEEIILLASKWQNVTKQRFY